MDEHAHASAVHSFPVQQITLTTLVDLIGTRVDDGAADAEVSAILSNFTK